MMTKKVATCAQRHVDPLRPWLLHKAGKLEIALLVRAEQAPNPDSRVLLTKERDALGVPRVALDWRLSAIDSFPPTFFWKSSAFCFPWMFSTGRPGRSRVMRSCSLRSPEAGPRSSRAVDTERCGRIRLDLQGVVQGACWLILGRGGARRRSRSCG